MKIPSTITTGSWSTTSAYRRVDGVLPHFAADTSDLLATTMFDYSFRPDWDNWGTLRKSRVTFRTRSVSGRYFRCRLSNAALRALHEAYCEGWSGHYEVTIPTILKTRGFTLEDIGGSGRYVAR